MNSLFSKDADAMNISTSTSATDTLSLSAHESRLLFRTGQFTGKTSQFSQGCVQGSLFILPREYALDFATYCHRNPKACPLLAIGLVGDPYLPMLGQDLDIRTDVPRYRVMHNGEVIDEPTDIKNLWRDDFVSFVLGCSFSFEHALTMSGVSLRECARGDNVVMYQTNIDTFSVGPFGGKLIVTMRPLVPSQAIKAIQVTSRFPNVHGAPIHIGAPELIGISDLETPLFSGKPPQVRTDELPVFWACGVTALLAVKLARPSLCIMHKPGSMVIADLHNTGLALP